MLYTLLFIISYASMLVQGFSIHKRATCPDLSACNGYYPTLIGEYSVGFTCQYLRWVSGPTKGSELFQCNWGTDGNLVPSFNGGRTGVSDAVCPKTEMGSCSMVPPTSTTSVPPAATTSVSPPANGRVIHPSGNGEKCLDVRGNVRENGTPVQIYDCNGSGAQLWVWNQADTKVKLAGTDFCLDAGSYPASGVPMKIWTCYDNLPAQAFYRTADNRFAVTGKGQCLDLPNGRVENSNQVQTWVCTNGNTNQVWTE
ncbi:ricin B lectin domain-containing protein [Mrakia frigida]|uniref:RICIN domain-containing protein n=1 Tax=Mrakia frigida TaxID=29902 RepID=UPI003FCC1729